MQIIKRLGLNFSKIYCTFRYKRVLLTYKNKIPTIVEYAILKKVNYLQTIFFIVMNFQNIQEQLLFKETDKVTAFNPKTLKKLKLRKQLLSPLLYLCMQKLSRHFYLIPYRKMANGSYKRLESKPQFSYNFNKGKFHMERS